MLFSVRSTPEHLDDYSYIFFILTPLTDDDSDGPEDNLELTEDETEETEDNSELTEEVLVRADGDLQPAAILAE